MTFFQLKSHKSLLKNGKKNGFNHWVPRRYSNTTTGTVELSQGAAALMHSSQNTEFLCTVAPTPIQLLLASCTLRRYP